MHSLAIALKKNGHQVTGSDDAIFEALDQLGLNEIMVSMPNEMQRYVRHDNIKDEVLGNPYE